ncbi:hypothetical protein CYMTET_24108 [Cymbomonas tetramitiformis]|uniref:Uncharacterized protein n=1 Tax=Cymbomonas tetramitiformis TaxID=36881 RepID=A0AAE0FX05_9CHLO|nr:hypothetical protein CYMTET_24108 [Cymbomonas tetramitiformis]
MNLKDLLDCTGKLGRFKQGPMASALRHQKELLNGLKAFIPWSQQLSERRQQLLMETVVDTTVGKVGQKLQLGPTVTIPRPSATAVSAGVIRKTFLAAGRVLKATEALVVDWDKEDEVDMLSEDEEEEEEHDSPPKRKRPPKRVSFSPEPSTKQHSSPATSRSRAKALGRVRRAYRAALRIAKAVEEFPHAFGDEMEWSIRPGACPDIADHVTGDCEIATLDDMEDARECAPASLEKYIAFLPGSAVICHAHLRKCPEANTDSLPDPRKENWLEEIPAGKALFREDAGPGAGEKVANNNSIGKQRGVLDDFLYRVTAKSANSVLRGYSETADGFTELEEAASAHWDNILSVSTGDIERGPSETGRQQSPQSCNDFEGVSFTVPRDSIVARVRRLQRAEPSVSPCPLFNYYGVLDTVVEESAMRTWRDVVAEEYPCSGGAKASRSGSADSNTSRRMGVLVRVDTALRKLVEKEPVVVRDTYRGLQLWMTRLSVATLAVVSVVEAIEELAGELIDPDDDGEDGDQQIWGVYTSVDDEDLLDVPELVSDADSEDGDQHVWGACASAQGVPTLGDKVDEDDADLADVTELISDEDSDDGDTCDDESSVDVPELVSDSDEWVAAVDKEISSLVNDKKALEEVDFDEIPAEARVLNL